MFGRVTIEAGAGPLCTAPSALNPFQPPLRQAFSPPQTAMCRLSVGFSAGTARTSADCDVMSVEELCERKRAMATWWDQVVLPVGRLQD
jgi:hypothetical protein